MNTSFSFDKESSNTSKSTVSWIVGVVVFVFCFVAAFSAVISGIAALFGALMLAFGALAAWTLTAAVVLITIGPAFGLITLGSSTIAGIAALGVQWVSSKFSK